MRVLKFVALVLLCIPGAALHAAAHVVPALWSVNDRYVDWLHENFVKDLS